MSKYDFEVDLSNSTSTGLILNKVQKGSTVLEFGCANGRMTRYMKEALDCKVYIVEYEQSAFEVAMQYAKDGVCGDIMNFAWLEKFKDVKFDVIMFADVLEHLMNPKEAIIQAKKLLKPDGNIYISVPNVTHNDILLKEMGESFNYTKVGILDDTHIHFWGLENIQPFAEECGLKVAKIEATYCPTGKTEQFTEQDFYVNSLILNCLNERTCGEIYQFVVSMNNHAETTEQLLKQPTIKCHLYINTGEDFNSKDVIEFEAEHLKAGVYHAHYVIEDSSNVQQIRFDPIENQGCILKNLSVKQGEEELEQIYSECLELESGILLDGDDPMVIANIENHKDAVVIDATIMIPGKAYIDAVQKGCFEKKGEIIDLNNDIAGLNNEISGLNNEISGLNHKIESLNNEIANLNNLIHSYVTLVNRKEELLIGYEKLLSVRLINKLKPFIYKLKYVVSRIIRK